MGAPHCAAFVDRAYLGDEAAGRRDFQAQHEPWNRVRSHGGPGLSWGDPERTQYALVLVGMRHVALPLCRFFRSWLASAKPLTGNLNQQKDSWRKPVTSLFSHG